MVGMPVDIGEILHVLAHELRTPVGIAHGYVRLLLEDRLPQDADRRRALEQLQKALGRLTDLSQESSALANWFERDESAPARVGARALLDAVLATAFDFPVAADIARVSEHAALATTDGKQLERALGAMIRSTGRELRGRPCGVDAQSDASHLVIRVGDAARFDALAGGPDAADAAPLPIDRGGVGLALVHASLVLDANGGVCWSVNGSRQPVGVRLPLAE